jgi:hypothetical protein
MAILPRSTRLPRRLNRLRRPSLLAILFNRPHPRSVHGGATPIRRWQPRLPGGITLSSSNGPSCGIDACSVTILLRETRLPRRPATHHASSLDGPSSGINVCSVTILLRKTRLPRRQENHHASSLDGPSSGINVCSVTILLRKTRLPRRPLPTASGSRLLATIVCWWRWALRSPLNLFDQLLIPCIPILPYQRVFQKLVKRHLE